MQHPCLSERSISGDHNLGFHHRLVLFHPRSPFFSFAHVQRGFGQEFGGVRIACIGRSARPHGDMTGNRRRRFTLGRLITSRIVLLRGLIRQSKI